MGVKVGKPNFSIRKTNPQRQFLKCLCSLGIFQVLPKKKKNNQCRRLGNAGPQTMTRVTKNTDAMPSVTNNDAV